MLALFAALLLAQAASAAAPARSVPPGAFDALSRDAAAPRDAGRLDEAFALYAKALKLRPDWGGRAGTAVRLAPGSADAQHEEQEIKRLRNAIDAAHFSAGGTQ